MHAVALAAGHPDAAVVLRAHGRSFHFASQLLDAGQAARAARLYAFCRHVDDLADAPAAGADPREALAGLRRQLVAGAATHPVAADFLALRAEAGMPLRPALDLVDGVAGDLGPVAIADEAALVRYAYAVAGTVGLLMCPLLGARDRAALPFAVDLGIAMQLTNIARDVAEDARLGRRYLPGTWVDDAAASDIATASPALAAHLQSAVERLLALADAYYASGEAGLAYLPARPGFAIQVAARVYRGIGGRVRASGQGFLSSRCRVDPLRRVAIATQAVAARALRARGDARLPMHDGRLHAPLAVSPDEWEQRHVAD